MTPTPTKPMPILMKMVRTVLPTSPRPKLTKAEAGKGKRNPKRIKSPKNFLNFLDIELF